MTAWTKHGTFERKIRRMTTILGTPDRREGGGVYLSKGDQILFSQQSREAWNRTNIWNVVVSIENTFRRRIESSLIITHKSCFAKCSYLTGPPVRTGYIWQADFLERGMFVKFRIRQIGILTGLSCFRWTCQFHETGNSLKIWANVKFSTNML
jgi:hypothetical protein